MLANQNRVGLGTFRLSNETAEKTCKIALEMGYRLIDTAAVYRNEKGVGIALREYLNSSKELDRSNIFITSKLSPKDHRGYEAASKAFDLSLQNLGLEYLDLYLIHWPGAAGKNPSDPINKTLRNESWLALEEKQRSGLTSQIGVSNYTQEHLRQLMESADIKPYLLQVEFHPFLYQRDLLDYCKEHGVIFQAYSSLGEGALVSSCSSAYEIRGLDGMCKKHEKTKAQILLRWAIEHDVAVIPKSSSEDRLRQNINIMDFQLDDKDLDILDNLYFEHRFCWDPSAVY